MTSFRRGAVAVALAVLAITAACSDRQEPAERPAVRDAVQQRGADVPGRAAARAQPQPAVRAAGADDRGGG